MMKAAVVKDRDDAWMVEPSDRPDFAQILILEGDAIGHPVNADLYGDGHTVSDVLPFQHESG